MAAWNTVIAAIRSRGESLWPGLESAVPVKWPNDNDFALPYAVNAALPWLMIEVRWNGGGFMSLGAPGSNLVRREGHIWCHAFVAQGVGDERAHQLAARAAGMFEGQDFSGILCDAAMPGGEADSEDGNYFGQSVAIPFDFDETA